MVLRRKQFMGHHKPHTLDLPTDFFFGKIVSERKQFVRPVGRRDAAGKHRDPDNDA